MFAAISFSAAGLAIFLLSSDNRIDNQQGAVLLPAGISGGLLCLAVAKSDSRRFLDGVKALLLEAGRLGRCALTL